MSPSSHPQKREAFCQLLQLMKIQHSNLDEPDLISVYVGTWNMGKGPSWSLVWGGGRRSPQPPSWPFWGLRCC